MKKYFAFLTTAVLAVCVSCNKGNEGDNSGGGNKYTAPADIEAILPDDLEEIELNYEKQDKTLDFEWMCDEEDAEYSIVFSLNDDLSEAQTVDLGAGVFDTKLTHLQLDGILEGLGVGVYKTANVYWAIKNSKDATSEIRSMLLTRFFGPFTDPRDGNVYRVTKFSDITGETTHVWLADNMRATSYTDGTPLVVGSTAFDVIFYEPQGDDDAKYVDMMGGLYTWTAAVRDVSSAEDGVKVQGICPVGWHVSTKAEWEFAINNCVEPAKPGYCFKDIEGWGTGAVGSNSSKLNIVGTGYVWQNNSTILEFMQTAYFWMSTVPKDGDVIPWTPPVENFPTQAYTYGFTLAGTGAALYPYDRGRGYCVRCVLD